MRKSAEILQKQAYKLLPLRCAELIIHEAYAAASWKSASSSRCECLGPFGGSVSLRAYVKGLSISIIPLQLPLIHRLAFGKGAWKKNSNAANFEYLAAREMVSQILHLQLCDVRSIASVQREEIIHA